MICPNSSNVSLPYEKVSPSLLPLSQAKFLASCPECAGNCSGELYSANVQGNCSGKVCKANVQRNCSRDLFSGVDKKSESAEVKVAEFYGAERVRGPRPPAPHASVIIVKVYVPGPTDDA